MKLQDWRDAGKYFRFGDHRIFYRVEGQGPPLLLIHGYPTSSWDWAKVWQRLTSQFQCIALDMLGFGYSDKPRQAYSIFEQADIHIALMQELDFEACHVLSHDYGDTVAQELLARANEGRLPFRMWSLCLLNGGLFPETHRAVLMQKMLMTPLGGLLVRFMGRGTLEQNMLKIWGTVNPPSAQELDEFWELIKHNDGKLVMHRLIHYMAERRRNRERWVGALQQSTVPLRVIDGVVDPVSGGHMVDRYEQLVPNPDVVRLENVGHYPQVEAPEAVLVAFLEKIASLRDA